MNAKLNYVEQALSWLADTTLRKNDLLHRSQPQFRFRTLLAYPRGRHRYGRKDRVQIYFKTTQKSAKYLTSPLTTGMHLMCVSSQLEKPINSFRKTRVALYLFPHDRGLNRVQMEIHQHPRRLCCPIDGRILLRTSFTSAVKSCNMKMSTLSVHLLGRPVMVDQRPVSFIFAVSGKA